MTDYLLDRIKLKSKLSFWRNLAIIMVAVTTIFLVTKPHKVSSKLQGEYIARINIDGEIYEDHKRTEKLANIANDANIKAVIIHFDTPGGSAFGGENLYYSINKIAAKKPVIAVIGTMATSAGYMASVAADTIIARNTSLTGSIGALLITGEVSELAKKLGIDFIVIKSGNLKAEPLFTHPLTKEAEEATKDLVMSTYYSFIDIVSIGRKMPREEVLKLADGRVFTGEQAVKNKLIDLIGGEDEAIELLVSKNVVQKDTPIKDIEMHSHEDFLHSLSLPFKKIGESAELMNKIIKSSSTTITK